MVIAGRLVGSLATDPGLVAELAAACSRGAAAGLMGAPAGEVP
jgi:hypothetical protein